MFEVKEFWDAYQANGIGAAYEYSTSNLEGELDEHVPALVEEAKDREIDMMQFLSELDEVESNAIAADNDAGGVHPDSDNEASSDEDADVSAETPATDGQDRGEDSGSPAS
jgi:hypothetical protein